MSRSTIKSTRPLRPAVLIEALSRVFPSVNGEAHIPEEWSKAFRATHAYIQLHDWFTERESGPWIRLGSYSPEQDRYWKERLPKVPHSSTIWRKFLLRDVAKAAWNGETIEYAGIKLIFPAVPADDEVKRVRQSTNWRSLAGSNWLNALRLVEAANGNTALRASTLSHSEILG